jgi:HK97 family phage prohead protease
MSPYMERRTAIDLRAVGDKKSPRLAGYAAVFNSPSQDLGGFTEIVKPGAFTRTLASGADPLALVQHMPQLVLGRRSAGTLRLQEDARGLAFEIDMPPTQAAADLLVSVQRGDVRGASFAFSTPAGGDKWDVAGDGKVMRSLLAVDLVDVTITSQPAYADTSVALRSLQLFTRPLRLRAVRRFLEST